MAAVGNASELLGPLVVAIVAFFGLGFLLTITGPEWTHTIAAWMMLPGIFGGMTWVGVAILNGIGSRG